MSDKYNGGCLCGSVRYEINGSLSNPMLCHCKVCQKQSGSAVSTIIGVAKKDISISGQVKTITTPADSGRDIDRQFCPECGSPLFSISETFPDVIFVKVGTFDDTSWYKPQINIWSGSAQNWFPMDDNLMGFPGNPGG